MKKQIVSLCLSLLCLSLLVSACSGSRSLEVTSSGGVRAWIDQPLTGSTLPLGAYTLIAHGRGGVSSITFLVNTVTVGSTATDPAAALVTGEVVWNPSTPGEYAIQAQATGASGQAVSEAAYVCVSRPGQEANDCASYPPPSQSRGTDTTLTPGGTSGANIIFKLDASPSPVILGSCDDATKTLNFEVSVSDAAGAIEVGIHGFVRESGALSGGSEFFSALQDSGGSVFRSAYPLSNLPLSGLGTGGGTLVYRAYLMDANKNIFAESAEHSIPLRPCGSQTSGEKIQFKAGASPNPVYHGKCSPSVVTLEGWASDVSDAVEADFILTIVNAAGETQQQVLAGTPASGGYLASFDVNGVSSGFLTGDRGVLQYEFGLMNAEKTLYARSDQQTIAILPCGGERIATTTMPPYTIITTEVPGPLVITTTVPPPVIVTTEAPPAADTSGPSFNKPYASTGTAYYVNGCGDNAVTVYVGVSDPSGVSSVQVHFYYVPSKTGAPTTENIWDMKGSADGSYQLGIMDPTSKQAYPNLQGDSGQLIYWFVASDGAGNSSQSSQGSVSVLYCPG